MRIFDLLYSWLVQIGFTDPIHPPLTHMPIGLVTAALIFGLVALLLRRPVLKVSARHCALLAWLFIFPTVLLGFMDWQHYYHGVWLFPIQAKIFLASALFVLLSLAVILGFRGEEGTKRLLLLYFLCFLIVMGLGYFGGRLVFGGRAPAVPPEFQAGAKIFDSRCGSCHPQGANAVIPALPLKGAPPLADFTGFLAFIRDPRLPDGSQGPMPSFTAKDLSEQQARELYDYLIYEFGKPRGK